MGNGSGFPFVPWLSVPCVGKAQPGSAPVCVSLAPRTLLLLSLPWSSASALASGLGKWDKCPTAQVHAAFKKCCIISLTQKHSCLNLGLCILLFSIPSWVPVSPGLGHGLRAKVQLHKQPSASQGFHGKPRADTSTTVIPNLPFLGIVISSPDLAEIQGDRLGLEWNQNCILIVNICPEINVSELMFLSDQCVQKQMTLTN